MSTAACYAKTGKLLPGTALIWKQSVLFALHGAGAKERYKKHGLLFCQLCSLSPVQPSAVVDVIRISKSVWRATV